MKVEHEVRDPIHDFIAITSDERSIVDSPPVQRLRHIHQLATSYLVYPGATHRRFEHSLGVMALAGTAFEVLTHHQNLRDDVRELVPELNQPDNFSYWRTIVKMAALCHDIGHLPFSHAAEHELLTGGISHETLTSSLIRSEPMTTALNSMTPPAPPEMVAKIAIGPKKADAEFSNWEALLSEIVVGNAFGVDRMDYLLRDSHHAGVAYGRFDHHRLLSTMRILPSAPADKEEATEGQEPALGIEAGGIQAAESLVYARYLMFTQVYFHPVRIMYDLHLRDFMGVWFPDGYPADLTEHLAITDDQIFEGMRQAASDESHPGQDAASRILSRNHFKLLYQATPNDVARTLTSPGEMVTKAAKARYGENLVRHFKTEGSAGAVDFPVRDANRRVASSLSFSRILNQMEPISVDLVFIDPSLKDDAKSWLRGALEDLLEQSDTQAEDDEAEGQQ